MEVVKVRDLIDRAGLPILGSPPVVGLQFSPVCYLGVTRPSRKHGKLVWYVAFTLSSRAGFIVVWRPLSKGLRQGGTCFHREYRWWQARGHLAKHDARLATARRRGKLYLDRQHGVSQPHPAGARIHVDGGNAGQAQDFLEFLGAERRGRR